MNGVDRAVWWRFYRHFFMAGIKSRHACRPLFHVLLIISFALLMSSDTINERVDNLLPVLVLIASFGYVFESWRDYRVSGEKYRKIVIKMTPTFQAQGYRVEFIEPPLCTYDRIFTGRWIRFTRNRSPVTPMRTDEEHAGAEEHLAPFNPVDWQPLEGTWELMDPSKVKGYMPWLIQTKSMTWTFQNTASEATFDSFIESQANMCYFTIPVKKTIQQFTLQGNVLRKDLLRKNAVSVKDGLVKAYEGDVYVPIPMEDRRIRSLYKMGQNHIVLIQRSTQRETPNTLKMIEFEFEEDIPSDELLVAGFLDHLTEEELQDMGGVVRLQLELQEPTNFS